MATYTLDWSETNLGGSAVLSYGRGAVLDFTDKPAGATAALSCAAGLPAGSTTLAEFTVVTTGASVLTFRYHTSSEANYDKLHVDVDGVSQANYSGVIAWTTHPGISIPAAGVHTIRFRYDKDPGNVNADRVWVALLNITNTTTVNDDVRAVDSYGLEDGAVPAFVATSSWTNSAAEPITGTRSLRSPAAPAHNGSYDLTATKPAGTTYGVLGFDWKTSTETGWDKLNIFPNPAVATVSLTYSGSMSGRLAVILPPAESSVLFRYTKDGGGAAGSDAVWLDNLTLPAAAVGGGTTVVTSTRSASWRVLVRPSAVRAAVWDVRTPVTASRSTSWRSAARVAAERASSWRVGGAVATARAAVWRVRAAVSAAAGTGWDTRRGVDASRAAAWTVTRQVTVQRSALWNVEGTIGRVTSTASTTWAVRARTTTTRATTWDAQSLVVSVRVAVWDDRQTVDRTQGSSWRSESTVQTARAASWDTSAAVGRVLAARWDTRRSATVERPASWITRRRVVVTCSTSWSTFAELTAPLEGVVRVTLGARRARASVADRARPATLGPRRHTATLEGPP